MMDTIINEKLLTFKDIEKKIFEYACEMAREMTRELLEKYDRDLMVGRDKNAYRSKGKRHTTVKTIYGEVEYDRNVYEVKRDDGTHEFVYLLDEQLKIERVGLISQYLAEQLVAGITEQSYRDCAEEISRTTGQSISPMGVWNVIQSLGEAVCDDENKLVEEHKAGYIKGKEKAPVLFEEADGVYVNLQREKQDKGEIKVGIAYDGWKETGTDRYSLDGKVVVAGFSNSKEFHEYREAAIAEKYDMDETMIRIMNADGAEWIKNVSDPDTIFQLDPFHRNKAIKEAIPHPEAIRDIHEYLDRQDIDGLFDFLDAYKNSLSNDEEMERVSRLITYFANNRDGLLPYTERGIKLPANDKGLVYRDMGTMENHIWSIIAKRMKHNHTSWSIRGGNHLAKILAKKGCGRLGEVASKLKRPLFDSKKVENLTEEILSAAKIKMKSGSGYDYPVKGHLTWLDGKLGCKKHTSPVLSGGFTFVL